MKNKFCHEEATRVVRNHAETLVGIFLIAFASVCRESYTGGNGRARGIPAITQKLSDELPLQGW
jgi:hypothetical protein